MCREHDPFLTCNISGCPISGALFAPDVGNEAGLNRQLSTFVIPTVAEGSAVRLHALPVSSRVSPKRICSLRSWGTAAMSDIAKGKLTGWEQQNRALNSRVSHPSQTTRRMGHPAFIASSQGLCLAWRRTADPSATVGMTKGRVALPRRAVAESVVCGRSRDH
jgi:hypothetical protein